jgi:hypothetical protein
MTPRMVPLLPSNDGVNRNALNRDLRHGEQAGHQVRPGLSAPMALLRHRRTTVSGRSWYTP